MTAYDDAVLVDSPALYLAAQETAGTSLVDTSGNGHDATIEGGVVLDDTTDPAAPAAVGKHISLDGTTGNLILPGGAWFDPSGGFAFEGWFYIRTVGAWSSFFDFAAVVNTGDMFFAAYSSGSRMSTRVGGTTFNTGTGVGVTTATWTYLGLSVDSVGAASIYSDGALWATGTVGVPTAGTRDYKYIGRSSYASDPWLNASLSRIALYDAPLPADRFAAHYDAGMPAVVVPPVETDLTYANDGYDYTGLARVFYDPPVAEPPAHVRRTKVRQVHQSMPAPTLVDGRPT